MTARDRRDAALTHLQSQMGQRLGPSRSILVDQAMITDFGHTTQDDQFIHMDPDRAAETELGGTIAHGFLTLSLGSRFAYDCFEDLPGQRMGINYGMDRLRFLTPVRPGHRVFGSFELMAAEPRGEDGILRTSTLTIAIEGQEKPALVANWLGLILF